MYYVMFNMTSVNEIVLLYIQTVKLKMLQLYLLY